MLLHSEPRLECPDCRKLFHNKKYLLRSWCLVGLFQEVLGGSDTYAFLVLLRPGAVHVSLLLDVSYRLDNSSVLLSFFLFLCILVCLILLLSA
jgi:hypothetical protein